MGKWMKKIDGQAMQEPESGSAGEPSHIPAEDLADMVDGRLDSKKRQAYITHLDRCRHCYDLLSRTLTDVESVPSADRPARGLFGNIRTLAASIALIVAISGGVMFYQRDRSQLIIASLPVNKAISQILLENDSLTWKGQDRISRFEAILIENNIPVKGLDEVVLKAPYTQTKSFFRPKEKLNIRIENHVAYIEVTLE